MDREYQDTASFRLITNFRALRGWRLLRLESGFIEDCSNLAGQRHVFSPQFIVEIDFAFVQVEDRCAGLAIEIRMQKDLCTFWIRNDRAVVTLLGLADGLTDRTIIDDDRCLQELRSKMEKLDLR